MTRVIMGHRPCARAICAVKSKRIRIREGTSIARAIMQMRGIGTECLRGCFLYQFFACVRRSAVGGGMPIICSSSSKGIHQERRLAVTTQAAIDQHFRCGEVKILDDSNNNRKCLLYKIETVRCLCLCNKIKET